MQDWAEHLLAMAAVAGACALLLCFESSFYALWAERHDLHQKLKDLLGSLRHLQESEPHKVRREIDEVISSFVGYKRLLDQDASGWKRRSAELQLGVLIAFLETPCVNRAFRMANWRWACDWDRGLTEPSEARQRYMVVFPVVICLANLRRAARAQRWRPPFPQQAFPSKGSRDVEHMAAWCSDFLEQPGVRAFLKVKCQEANALRRCWHQHPVSRLKDECRTPLGCFMRGACCGIRSSYIQQEEEIPADTKDPLDFINSDAQYFPRRVHAGQRSCWDDVDSTVMMVRGSSYLDDRCRVRSEGSMLKLLACDLYITDDPVVHYCASRRVGNIVRKIRKSGDNRFLFVTNWLISPFQFVVIWVVPQDADWQESPEGRLFRAFRTMSDDERNQRLKVIPRVIEAPSMLKRALPETPSMLGKRIPIGYFGGSNYLEASLGVVSSPIGRQILGLMQSASSANSEFSVEIFLLIEGQSTSELPERILGGFSTHRVDAARLPKR